MMKLPITSCHSCGLLNHLNSFHRGMFKLNSKCDADSLLYSLNHFECDGHTVHMLIQWCLQPLLTSTVKSSLFTYVHQVHSLWLPGDFNATQTIFVILTTAGIFPDRPCIPGILLCTQTCRPKNQCPHSRSINLFQPLGSKFYTLYLRVIFIQSIIHLLIQFQLAL